MRNLRGARQLWASREGFIEKPPFTYDAWLAAAMLNGRDRRKRGP